MSMSKKKGGTHYIEFAGGAKGATSAAGGGKGAASAAGGGAGGGAAGAGGGGGTPGYVEMPGQAQKAATQTKKVGGYVSIAKAGQTKLGKPAPGVTDNYVKLAPGATKRMPGRSAKGTSPPGATRLGKTMASNIKKTKMTKMGGTQMGTQMTRAQPTVRPKSMMPTIHTGETTPMGEEGGGESPEGGEGGEGGGEEEGASPSMAGGGGGQSAATSRKGGASAASGQSRRVPSKSHYLKRLRDYYRKPKSDRKMAELLQMLINSRQGQPELFPRIFAVSLVWIIIFAALMAHLIMNTENLKPWKMLLHIQAATSEKYWCYMESMLYIDPNFCCPFIEPATTDAPAPPPDPTA